MLSKVKGCQSVFLRETVNDYYSLIRYFFDKNKEVMKI